MIQATVIADSVSPENIRITTFRLRYPKFIHGEVMTHRVFSRNASSSRAVPTAKLIEEASSFKTRACPVEWGKNQKGMQATEVLSKECEDQAVDIWMRAACAGAAFAQRMVELGVHKQIANRIIEPFTHINVVVTATRWKNFFGLRLDEGAQPEAKFLAEKMWQARQLSTPKLIERDQWHLPFVEDFDQTVANEKEKMDMIKVSVARCARTSYLSFDTQKPSTFEEDLALYDRLLSKQPIHASPAEHQATPVYPDTAKFLMGNFHGWIQYRKLLPEEECAPLPEGYEDDFFED